MISNNVCCDWIITYDVATEIEEIYKNYNIYCYDLNYSVSTKCTANELIILGMVLFLLQMKCLNRQI